MKRVELELDASLQAVPGDFGVRLSVQANRLFIPQPLADLANQQVLETAQELHGFCTGFPGAIVQHMQWQPVDAFNAIQKLHDVLVRAGVISDPAKVKPYQPGLI